MSPNLENKLLLEFRDLFFVNYGPRPKETFIGNFACGDGWYNLLYQTLTTIRKEVEKEKQKRGFWKSFFRKFKEVTLVLSEQDDDGEPESCKVAQIKEKFGTLTIYTRGWDNIVIREAINEAMRQSAKVCESCGGTPAQNREKGGWLRTRCAGCDLTAR